MGHPYTLQKKRNPQKPDEPYKWYAVSKSGTPVKEKVMTKLATEDTTVADFELAASAKLIAKWVYNQLVQGKRAKVPGVGTFRITFGSEGVENIQDFHTGLIRNVKINFIPDSDLRAQVLQDITFENDGVMDDGVYYGTLANYYEVKGIKPGTGGSVPVEPGGGEEGGGGDDVTDDPLD